MENLLWIVAAVFAVCVGAGAVAGFRRERPGGDAARAMRVFLMAKPQMEACGLDEDLAVDLAIHVKCAVWKAVRSKELQGRSDGDLAAMAVASSLEHLHDPLGDVPSCLRQL